MRRYNIEIQGRPYAIDVEDIDANHYRVTLDHQTYDVSLSCAGESAEAKVTPAMAPASQHPRVPAAIERPTPLAQPAKPETRVRTLNVPSPALTPVMTKGFRPALTAPMPGTIQEILVKPGDRVQRGQAIVILEAMKMKNTIKSAQDRVIGQVIAEQGKAVRYGDVLVCFEEPTP